MSPFSHFPPPPFFVIANILEIKRTLPQRVPQVYAELMASIFKERVILWVHSESCTRLFDFVAIEFYGVFVLSQPQNMLGECLVVHASLQHEIPSLKLMRAVRLGVKFSLFHSFHASVFLSVLKCLQKKKLFCRRTTVFSCTTHPTPKFQSVPAHIPILQILPRPQPSVIHPISPSAITATHHHVLLCVDTFSSSLTEAPLFSYSAVLYNRSQSSNHWQYPKCITSYHYDTSFTQPKMKKKLK